MSHQATGWVLEFSESQLGARLVLHEIAYRLNIENGICWPSLDTIAYECRMSKPGVIQAMERLEESGELAVDREDRPGSGAVNRYSMPLFWDWWEQAKLIPQKGKKGIVEKGKKGIVDPKKGKPHAEKGKAALPELEVELSLREQEGSAAPQTGALCTACGLYGVHACKGRPRNYKEPRERYRKEGKSYVQEVAKRSVAEERREQTAKALRVLGHPELLPEDIRRVLAQK